MSSSPLTPDSRRIQRVNPLEIGNWDEIVTRFPHAGVFHTAGWARVLHDTYGYEPLYLLDGEVTQPRAILPLMEVSSFLTGRRGVSLPFTDAVEPLGEAAPLFSAAQEIGRERNWKYLECRGGREGIGSATASTVFYRHRLALDPNTDALFDRCDAAVRRAVRKAERSGLVVEFAQDARAIGDFYHLMCLTRRRHGLPPQPFAFFSAIQRHLLANQRGWVVLARQGATPIAGAVYFHHGGEALYKFGASDETFRELRPNNLVMWAAIRRYASDGMRHLDFGRTSLDHDGLRRFKLSWGTAESRADYVRFDLQRSEFTTVPDGASGWHNRAFRAFPLWLSRALGEAMYRHIG